MTRDVVTDLARQFNAHKLSATGVSAAAFPNRAEMPIDAPFQKVVVTIGDWYLTELRADRDVLWSSATREEQSSLSEFQSLLSIQRNSFAHPADSELALKAQAWRDRIRSSLSDPAVDSSMADAILTELVSALRVLCGIAARMSTDPSHLQRWRNVANASPEEEVLAVYADLGRHLFDSRKTHVVQQFVKHPDLKRAKSTEERANVAAVVVLGITTAPLRQPYSKLLDEFTLIGDSRAAALLLLAHAVQAAGIHGSRLQTVLKELWDVIERPPV